MKTSLKKTKNKKQKPKQFSRSAPCFHQYLSTKSSGKSPNIVSCKDKKNLFKLHLVNDILVQEQ